jgi:putative thioredoxin
LGRALLAEQKTDEGLEMLLSAARRDLGFRDGEPRKALLEAFAALGDNNPLVTKYRRELSLLLCS